MGQPATAGAVVAGIFGFFALAFFGYRFYRWVYWRGVSRSADVVAQGELPMTNNPLMGGRTVTTPPAYASPGSMSNRSTMVVGSLYGDAYHRDSWKGGSLPGTPFLTPTGSDVERHRRRYSSISGMVATTPGSENGATGGGAVGDAASAMGSPRSEGAADKELLSTPSESYDPSSLNGRSRAISSSSSTMTIKRLHAASSVRPSSTYAGSAYGGSSRSISGLAGHNYERRRDSYLPHLPENRDQIQIIPPQPLGFGLGGMAQAIDQRTLGFSKTSGIGEFSDDFSKGLIWHVQQGNEEATSRAVQSGLMTSEEAAQLRAEGASAAGPSSIPASGTMTEEERMRYLAQGPQRSLTPNQRAQIHNHIYPNSQPASLGQRTPDIEQSPRSHSPAREPWVPGTGSNGSAVNGDGGYTSSGSDIGPSVSQRGGATPSTLTQAASTVPSSSVTMAPSAAPIQAPSNDATKVLDVTQSPLDKLRVNGVDVGPQGDSLSGAASPLLDQQFASFGQVNAEQPQQAETKTDTAATSA